MESEETDKVETIENNGVDSLQEPIDVADESEKNEDVSEVKTIAKTRASARPKRNCTAASPNEVKKTTRGRGRGKKVDKDSDKEALKNDEQNNGECQNESNAGDEPYDPHEVDEQFSDATEPENKEEVQSKIKEEKVSIKWTNFSRKEPSSLQGCKECASLSILRDFQKVKPVFISTPKVMNKMEFDTHLQGHTMSTQTGFLMTLSEFDEIWWSFRFQLD